MLNLLALAHPLLVVKTAPVPPEVVGRWQYTNGDPTLLAKPSDGAATLEGKATSRLLVLGADGTYHQDSTTLMGRKGHRMRVSCSVEGRFQAGDGRILFMVERGRQSGEDNILESGNYDRPLAPDAVKRMCESCGYRSRSEGGQPALVLQPTDSARDDMAFLPVRAIG